MAASPTTRTTRPVAGATHEQVVETVGVAVTMGGALAAVYRAEAADALRRFDGGG